MYITENPFVIIEFNSFSNLSSTICGNCSPYNSCAFSYAIFFISSLVTLFFITKLLGRKQVSELTLFDYVIGISIGNFSAEMTINLESNEINGIVAVLTFGIIAYAISILTMKSEKVRNYVTGPPTILIEKGNLMYKNLQKVHFDVNDLLQECRINGYFDIYQIEYALMEANGQVSFLPKKDYANITLKDMNLKEEKMKGESPKDDDKQQQSKSNDVHASEFKF